jgi:putative ABC transport system ATP-binding protein
VRRDRMGLVFQFFNLLPTLTAHENITLPLALAKCKPDQAWLDQLIATVGLEDRLHHCPSELSGGQQQRVAVATRSRPEAASGLCRRAHRQPRLQARGGPSDVPTP